MPLSMTGFGQADANGYHVEIKGINHRYKDIKIKMPRDLSSLEIPVREIVSEAVNRGKVDVLVTKNTSSGAQDKMSINWDLAKAYFDDLSSMANAFNGEVTFRDILLIPGILDEGSLKMEDQFPLIRQALEKAIVLFTDSRENEGSNLTKDIHARTVNLQAMAESMKELASDMTSVYKERLHTSLDALLSDKAKMIDAVRLEQEVAILADKCDVTEELVRLGSHIRLLEETIKTHKGPIGRQADFILQEINREINTIGSKSQVNGLSRKVIDAKTEIEKIREQIQNIE